MKIEVNTSAVCAVVLRHLFSWRRDLDRFIDAFWWPMLDLFIFGLTSLYIQKNNPSNVNFTYLFLGGLTFWTVIANTQRHITMPLLDEAWNRNLINIFVSPIKFSEFILATIFLSLIKLVMTIATLWIIAFLFFNFNLLDFGWFLPFAFINLIITGCSIAFFIDGIIFLYGYRMQALAWALVYIVLPFSAVYYPVSTLPYSLQFVSLALPTSYIFENMRSVLIAGRFSYQDIMMSSILNILYLWLASIFLKSMFNKAKEKGRIVKLN